MTPVWFYLPAAAVGFLVGVVCSWVAGRLGWGTAAGAVLTILVLLGIATAFVLVERK